MERFFNIAGPCVAAKHYMLPAAERLPEVVGMIRRELYFVIHAPRQSGKTTALKQLVRDINGSGERVALYCSLETLQNVTDVASAMNTVETVVWKAVGGEDRHGGCRAGRQDDTPDSLLKSVGPNPLQLFVGFGIILTEKR